MYEGPVIYESHVTDFFLLVLLILLAVAFLLFYIVCFYRLFKKAGKNPWTCLIPFYNIFVILNMATLPKYYFLLLLIPIVNLFPIARISQELARSFKKSSSFAVGLFFLPMIYYPILAFSDSRYIGINEEKVQSIQLKDVSLERKKPAPVPVSKTSPATSNQASTPTAPSQPNVNPSVSSSPVAPPPIIPIEKPAEYKECPECHNKVKAEAKSCFICGHKFS